MPSNNHTPQTRHGKRRDGQVLMTFQLPLALKNEITELAAKDDRTPSAWLRRELQSMVRRSRAARKAA